MKQIFVSTLMFFGSLSKVNPLECVSMNDQECKVRSEILIVMSLYFIILVLKQVNAVVVVTILITPMQNCVFLILLKI